VQIDEESAQLRAALASNTARMVITTLQKFPVVAEQAQCWTAGAVPSSQDELKGNLRLVTPIDAGSTRSRAR